MLTDEKGAKMAPFEEALLQNYDGKIALVLINGDRNGYCDLTEDFVCALLKKVWNSTEGYTIVSRVLNNQDFLTPKVVDTVFATEDLSLITQYLHSSHCHGMESRHIIQLLKMDDAELIEFYFQRYATIVLQDNWYAPVVDWLKENGLYPQFRARYMPKKKFL